MSGIAPEHAKRREIDKTRPQRTERRCDTQRDATDDHRGDDREKRRHDLILDNPVAAERSDRRIDQEQANRLSVPDVEIGHRAMPDPVADQQIELVVDLDNGIAELRTAQGKRKQEKDDCRTTG